MLANRDKSEIALESTHNLVHRSNMKPHHLLLALATFAFVSLSIGQNEVHSQTNTASTAESYPNRAYVQASRVNLRKLPSIKGRPLGKLTIGTQVEVLNRKQGWIQIRHADLTGWTLESLLSNEKPTLQGMLDKYNALDKREIKERRSWAERAAALAPHDINAVRLLVDALRAAGDKKRLRKAKQGLKALLPIYFSNGTFSDDPVERTLFLPEDNVRHPPRLSCRKKFIKKYTHNVPPPANAPWKKTLPTKHAWGFAQKHCSEFSAERTVWSFVANKATKTAQWKNIALQPSVTIRSYMEDGCSGDLVKPPNGDLVFQFNRTSDGPKPSLFLSSLNPPPQKSVPYLKLIKTTEKSVSKNIYRTPLKGAEQVEEIREVFLETHREKFMGEGYYPNAVRSEKLVVIWSSGSRSEIVTSKGYGHYSWADAGISSVVLTDLDHDKGIDFIVKAKRSQHELVLTQNQEIRIKHTLEPEESEPVGGC